MPRSRPPYSSEYRQQMVDLVRGGRTPDSLSREFEPNGAVVATYGISDIYLRFQGL